MTAEPPVSLTDAPLTIHLIGTFQMEQGGLPLPRLRSRSEQWLLALLILHHRQAVDRDWLAGVLWSDTPQAQALRNLRRSLNNLRHVLGTEAARIFAPTPRTIAFDVSGMVCDVVAFDSAIRRGDSVSLTKAVELYRGSLLEGCAEDWILAERAAREQAYLAALERLGQEASEGGEFEAAIRYLRLAVTTDPFSEAAQRHLMKALAANGDMVGATLVYRQFRLRLQEELRAEPAPETREFYQQLRHEARRRRQPSPRDERQTNRQLLHLPLPFSEMIGRKQEIEKIRSRLSSARLLTLTGTGGVGKTRLALAAVQTLAADFPDGIWFVDLAPLTHGDFVPQAVASRLAVREEAGRFLQASLTEFLTAKRLLLILDNCEHLVPACASLSDHLLQNCPHLCILTTSRQTLGILGETALAVLPLSLPAEQEILDVHAAALYDALLLFVERAMEASPSFALTPQNAPTVAAICRRLDGMPLALELAAARVKSLSVEQIAARLDKAFSLLTGGSRTAPPRQQTLRATIDWSYALLSEQERTLFQRLSVFRGSWSLEAAEMICADAETQQTVRLEASQVLDVLEALIDKSLVMAEPGDGGEIRYRFLESLRQYSEEKLHAVGAAVNLQERHRDYFLWLSEMALPELSGKEIAATLQNLEQERDNLRAAVQFCADDPAGAEKELRFVVALGAYWYMRGYMEEGKARLSHAIAGTEGLAADANRGKALNLLGWTLHLQGNDEAAHPFFQKSLALFRQLNDTHGIGQSLNRLGCVAKAQGEFDLAADLLEQSLLHFEAVGELRNMAFVLNNLGTLAEEKYDNPAADTFYRKGLEIARKLDHTDVLALLLGNLGALAYRQREYSDAAASIRESLRLRYAMGDKLHLCYSLQEMAAVSAAQEQILRATCLHGVVTALCEEMNVQWMLNDPEYCEIVAKLHEAQSEESFTSAFTQGSTLSLQDAIDYALNDYP